MERLFSYVLIDNEGNIFNEPDLSEKQMDVHEAMLAFNWLNAQEWVSSGNDINELEYYKFNVTERDPSKKVEKGQFFTRSNPFTHELFKKWINMEGIRNEKILEPFAGANHIVKMIQDIGKNNQWDCYDINPPKENCTPEFQVIERDTIKDFPQGYKICITNPPYLGKSSARKKKLNYEWEEDDLYKHCLKLMLENCGYVAAIIPESFITSNFPKDRLWGVISLAYKMFDDTDCPVCLALFIPNKRTATDVYVNDERLGSLQRLLEISNELLSFDCKENIDNHKWVFNDPNGSIGVKTVDGITEDNLCSFFEGEKINPEKIVVSARAYTRVSGLPENIDRKEFIDLCNHLLNEYRKKTKDITLTSFKGLRKDGKYRRRLDFKTVRAIMNKALCIIHSNNN